MISTRLEWNGVIASIYYMSKGDRLGVHKHDVAHNTFVIRGRTRVEIDGIAFGEMGVGDLAVTLPENIKHDVIALRDDTIIINMIAEGGRVFVDDAPGGGVALDGGVVLT